MSETTTDPTPADVLRKVADEIEAFTRTSPERPAHDRDISWLRLRAWQLDGQHNPHPSPFEQAVHWLWETSSGDSPGAEHARQLIGDLCLDLEI